MLIFDRHLEQIGLDRTGPAAKLPAIVPRRIRNFSVSLQRIRHRQFLSTLDGCSDIGMGMKILY